MFKRLFSSLVLVATVALYGCGGGGSGSGSGGGGDTPTLFTLKSINITSAGTNLSVNSTLQFTATGTSTADLTMVLPSTVTWISDTPSVAIIDETTGVATAKAAGTTKITLKDTDSGIVSNAITLTVTAALSVTTIAGTPGVSGSADGAGTAAQFKNPYSINTDGTDLYVADTFNSTIRKIEISTGAVTTIAGSPGLSGSVDGTGSAARLNAPYGITAVGGNLYVTNGLSNTIRKIEISTGAVTTIAGSPNLSGSTDGTGSAARFNQPTGITTDGSNLYVADNQNNSIRKIEISSGVVTTVANLDKPVAITTDGAYLYVTDITGHIISKILISSGSVTPITIAGNFGVSGSTDGTGTAALFNTPFGITTDGTNLYVADIDNHNIRKIVISTGVVTTIATLNSTSKPSGITLIGTTLYTCNLDNTISKLQ